MIHSLITMLCKVLVYLLNFFYLHSSLLTSFFSTSLRIGLFCFQAGLPEVVRDDQTWLYLFVLISCCCILLWRHVCFFVLHLVFQYLARRLLGKKVSNMTYFVSGGT